MYRLLVLSLMLLLTGCVSIGSSYYQSAVTSWRGANVNTLFESWGKPTSQIRDANGNTTYIYRTINPINQGTLSGNLGKRHRFQNSCLAIFGVNQQGVIVHAESRGVHCTKRVNFAQL